MGQTITSTLFQPPRPQSYSHNPSFLTLDTHRGQRIGALFINRRAPLTILFSHGNAEDLGMISSWFHGISQMLHVNIMLYDYTGYGINNALPSEKDCYADIDAAFRYLTVEQGKAPGSIILYGRSLGTGPTVELAMQQSIKGDPVAGVILQSALLSAYRVALHFRFSMPGDVFCSIDKIGKVSCPVLFIHGKQDEELFFGIQPSHRIDPFWIEEAGHNNIELLSHRNNTFAPRLSAFFSAVCPEWGTFRKNQSAASYHSLHNVGELVLEHIPRLMHRLVGRNSSSNDSANGSDSDASQKTSSRQRSRTISSNMSFGLD